MFLYLELTPAWTKPQAMLPGLRYHRSVGAFMAFQLFSTAFGDGDWIPSLHSCQGADLSPALEWSGEPNDTRSFALVVDDPDAPAGNWCHWLLYDIGLQLHNLPQGVKAGAVGLDGVNDFGRKGYNGPCPPRGKPHRYFFKLFALNVETLGIPAGAKRAALLAALEPRVAGKAQYMGRFERK